MTGARSVRPSRGRRFVKTCARDRGGFLRNAIHPVAARRQRTGAAPRGARRHPGGSRIQPGAGIPSQDANPAWDLPPCQRAATWCTVNLPGDSSSEPRPGSRRCESAEPVRVACAPCPGRTTDGRRSSRRAARALGRARLTREGRRCVPLHGYRTALGCHGPFTPQRWLRSQAGSVSYPSEPRGLAEKPFAHRRPARHASTGEHGNGCPTGAKPRRGG